MRKLLKKYDLDSFEVAVMELFLVAFLAKVVEYYFNLLRGILWKNYQKLLEK